MSHFMCMGSDSLHHRSKRQLEVGTGYPDSVKTPMAQVEVCNNQAGHDRRRIKYLCLTRMMDRYGVKEEG